MDYQRIGAEFKRFVRNRGYPKSLYRQKCDEDASDVCGGKGNTCAPDDAPEDFEELLRRFCEENEYDYDRIVDRSTPWIADLEQDVPGETEGVAGFEFRRR